MAIFLSISDFQNGELAIGKNQFTSPVLQEYIDRIEPERLLNLLGATLFDAFIADYDTGTKTFSNPDFQAIYNAFYIDESHCVIESKGMKKMLEELKATSQDKIYEGYLALSDRATRLQTMVIQQEKEIGKLQQTIKKDQDWINTLSHEIQKLRQRIMIIKGILNEIG